VADALGARPRAVLASRDYLAVFESEDEVRALRPDVARVAALDRMAVIATAPGRDCDFVSRFFVPSLGIPEDPVTGSAHCTLVPYWSKRLGKASLFARQVSSRGGELWCEDRGERVAIAGQCVKYLEGTIELPGE
jgi:predicted PhzF superfamily epimerase YddE/YHI9